MIRTLESLFRVHGELEFIRSDNGPEFIANAVKAWLASAGVKTLYIEPGSPWENAYVESFNSRLEDELLGRELFTSLKEAKVLVEQYRVEYNHERPHSSLGYRTPVEYAASCAEKNVASSPDGATAFVLSQAEGEKNNEWTPEPVPKNQIGGTRGMPPINASPDVRVVEPFHIGQG